MDNNNYKTPALIATEVISTPQRATLIQKCCTQINYIIRTGLWIVVFEHQGEWYSVKHTSPGYYEGYYRDFYIITYVDFTGQEHTVPCLAYSPFKLYMNRSIV